MSKEYQSEKNNPRELFRRRLGEVHGISVECETREEAVKYIADTTASAIIENVLIGCSGFDHEIIKEEMMRKGISTIDSAGACRPEIEFAGITGAEFAIAETGTIVLDASSPEVRAAAQLSKIHFAIIKPGDIIDGPDETEKRLVPMLKKSRGFFSMITGPSRTADIERVLATGVHGPIELHVIILDKGL